MFFKTKAFGMSLDSDAQHLRLPTAPTFAEYGQALSRLRRLTALRRAVMDVGLESSLEMIVEQEQERRDRELLDVWERQYGGPGWLGC
jgi:hypothetical protein